MKFTEEDGIISAAEARLRSIDGTEDSQQRESIRMAMEYIKRSSYYGHRVTVLLRLPEWQSLKTFPETQKMFEDWGYEIRETEHVEPSSNKTYSWYISW